jgi:hypothetical protein
MYRFFVIIHTLHFRPQRNLFAALENLDTEGDVNKAWETIRENIKISAKESLGYYEPKKN